jgi:hypothetical protein
MKFVFLGMVAFVVWATQCVPASAEAIDASTISCSRIAEAMERKSEKDMSFVNGILNWMGGYHATEAQGTVVDWKKLSNAFNQTIAYCVEHTNVGVMSASDKYMGEHIEEAGPDAFDLAIITCETLVSDKSPLKDVGNTFMWLAGYHTSSQKASTMLDVDKFVEHVSKIADYCAANPKTGLVTASEKFMATDE